MAKWQKGQSGNPKGRTPNEQTIAGALREVGNRIDPKTGKQNFMALAETAFKLGLEGNVASIVYITERLEGRAVSLIDMRMQVNRGADPREYDDGELMKIIEKARDQETLAALEPPTDTKQ